MNKVRDFKSAFAPSLQASQAFLKRYSLSSLLPYLAFDEERELFINKKSTGFIVCILGMGEKPSPLGDGFS